jgi:hypothetical protein
MQTLGAAYDVIGIREADIPEAKTANVGFSIIKKSKS